MIYILIAAIALAFAILPNLLTDDLKLILEKVGFYRVNLGFRMLISLLIALVLGIALSWAQDGLDGSSTSTTNDFPSNNRENELLLPDQQVSQVRECYGPYLKPSPAVQSISVETTSIGRVPLLPVPSDNPAIIENGALYPEIEEGQLLGIIGRAPDNFGQWLYIQLEREGNIDKQGFIRLENTTFQGNYKSLSVISIQEC